MTHPEDRGLTLLTTYYGDDFDAAVYTTGGTYHTVFVTNIDDGSSTEHRFQSRAKAVAFAEGAAA